MFRWLVFALSLLFALPALAQQPDCSNPQSAADTLFVFQRDDGYDLKKASACFELTDGQNGERLAVQLRQVLDARGLWVPVSTMPTDPDHVDEAGNHRVIPMAAEAPWLEYVKLDDGRWVYSQGTLATVPSLYADTFSPVNQWFQERLPGVFYTRVLGLYLWQLLYASLLVLFAWLAGRLVDWVLTHQVRRWVGRLGVELPTSAYRQLRLPLVMLIVSAILLWGVTDLQLSINASWLLHTVFRILLALSIVLALSRAVKVVAGVAEERAKGTESRLDDQVIPLLRQAAQVVVWSLGVLFILQNQGVDVAGLIAGVGIGGLAFALAAKDTLANLFGSLNIFMDKPFQIGDWVKIGDVEGTVEEVGFRSTRVRTFYNSVITVPNSSITNANVDNLGLRHRRRVKLTLGLTYDTPPDKLQAYVEGLRAILAAHSGVEKTYEVHFYNFGASALEILVYYHLVVPSWTAELEARSQNFLEFMRLAEELDVSFAFPSTSVYVESTPEKPMQPQEARSIEELEAAYQAFGPDGSKARPGGPAFQHQFTVQQLTDRGSAG